MKRPIDIHGSYVYSALGLYVHTAKWRICDEDSTWIGHLNKKTRWICIQNSQFERIGTCISCIR